VAPLLSGSTLVGEESAVMIGGDSSEPADRNITAAAPPMTAIVRSAAIASGPRRERRGSKALASSSG
jgi:hypothetical protein